VTGTQDIPMTVHETQFGTRTHHRDAKCFECSRSKDSTAYSCVRCWNGIDGDDFLCGECFLELATEIHSNIADGK
jgi:predicted amidophosphoribosyltransferase